MDPGNEIDDRRAGLDRRPVRKSPLTGVGREGVLLTILQPAPNRNEMRMSPNNELSLKKTTKMTMPSLTAEASLYGSKSNYAAVAGEPFGRCSGSTTVVLAGLLRYFGHQPQPMRRAWRESGQSAHSGGADKRAVSVNPLPISDEILAQACRSKSIPDGTIEVIRLAGHPLSEEEIADGLRRAGVTFVSNRPAVNVRFYLLKKRKETGAVKLTDDKRWDIDESYSPESGPTRSGFVPNRDRNEHAERSRRGLLAARERGAKGGRRSKITPEMKETAERMIAEGAHQTEIAKQIGITPITLHRWREKGIVSDKRIISNDAA